MPRKGENIYKRKDGRWEGRYAANKTITGKTKYKSIYAKTYTEAKRKLFEEKTKLSKVQEIIDGSLLEHELSQLAAEWLLYVKPKIKESSFAKYSNIIDWYINPFIGHFQIKQINSVVIESYIDSLYRSGSKNNKGLSPRTVSDVMSVIRRIFYYINRQCPDFTFQLTRICGKQKKATIKILSKTEQNVLINYLCSDLTLKNIGILLTLFSGIRIGELCALRWDDIDLNEGMLTVSRTMQRVQNKSLDSQQKTHIVITNPKSECSIRTIPLPVFLAEILKEQKEHSYGFFLTGHEDLFIEPRSMQYYFKITLEKAKIDHVNFHVLRHTFATRCIELGFDLKSLSEILGHASVNITLNRYVHPSIELKQSHMEKLDVLFTVK